jgi:uncharacterized protein (DUF608 family)
MEKTGVIFRKSILTLFILFVLFSCKKSVENKAYEKMRDFNGSYTGEYLNRLAFPIGGIGTGMICLEGTGAISHVSVRNNPEIFNEPFTFAAISVKGTENGTKVLEGPVPRWKIFGSEGTGNGAAGASFGLPRFDKASFLARFPFGTVTLNDTDIPLEVNITGWSPFIPGDADNSSLPAGALEYHFKNTSNADIEAVFSWSAKNFMSLGKGNSIKSIDNGFILHQEGTEENPEFEGDFAVFIADDETVIDHCWFRGGWWDPLTIAWKNILNGELINNPPVESNAPGASLFVPFALKPGAEKTICLCFSWYVPNTDLRIGRDPEENLDVSWEAVSYNVSKTHKPWYSGKFESVKDIAGYWRENYSDLREKTEIFKKSFYDTDLPEEVIEAVAANLTILKSPTVMRQTDGRLWCWEGCEDNRGSCHGSCTHVWNYAQAIPNLFPKLERSLRQTEFNESQDERGHQTFRANLPIRPVVHEFHAASDGQLGGIMKIYREWRKSGDNQWLREFWLKVKKSMDYCILTWDPREKGVLEEPHHNTYDIEFWGPDGMCTSFYLGALKAMSEMGKYIGEDVTKYETLFAKGKKFVEEQLFNGEYFIQKIQLEGLNSPNPVEASKGSWTANYSEEAQKLLEEEGPKYQYGTGCLSDGILGAWIAQMCGLGEFLDPEKVKSHLKAVHTYNLKYDLRDHSNPQRPSFALGNEGGLLLCTWPKGGELSLPFVYSNEVWTGIEYQVASHLMLEGMVEEGLDIVRTCRKRYDGRIRNPFNEYECGHWYARSLASYGLIQGLTGMRYDAVDKILYIDSKIGDNFRAFISTETGFGTAGLENGEPFINIRMGHIDVNQINVSGKLFENKT